MANRLIIFASSRRPDTYFNIIAHNARQGVREFTIAAIGDLPSETAEQRVSSLNLELNQFVEGLQRSRYLTFGSTPGDSMLTSPQDMKDLLDSFSWGSLRFSYQSVSDSELEGFLAENLKTGVSFDVTACKNTALAPTVAWIVARGGSPIQTFEITKELTFTEKDLLPYLKTIEYKYIDLAKSSLIRKAVQRVNIGSIHRRTFWFISAAVAVAVGALTLLVPAAFSAPILAAAATFATIMSGVSILVRHPN